MVEAKRTEPQPHEQPRRAIAVIEPVGDRWRARFWRLCPEGAVLCPVESEGEWSEVAGVVRAVLDPNGRHVVPHTDKRA